MYKYAKLPSSIRGGVFAICLLFFHGIPTLVFRVGQNRICTPYMTVYMVISLLDYRMYTMYTYVCMILANPISIATVGYEPPARCALSACKFLQS